MTCREEVVALTRALIAVDTSNPPGRETAAARVLARHLADAGVECELVGPDPERLNLVARLRGAGRGPSLLLLGHTDVVPAPPKGWTTPPFEAAVRDGLLFGRGAADMKGELAARAVALATIARAGEVPDGDVMLIAEADEEDNVADVGMSWLARERPELRCDFALNEGGGQLLELDDGGRVVTIAVAEKQVTALRIRIFGEGGHASVPTRTDNAVLDGARTIERLLAYEAPCTLLPAVRRTLVALGAGDRDDDEAVAWACGRHPMLARMLPAMTRMTVTPTGVDTNGPPNVIPRHVDVTCDCRPLPGQTQPDVRAHVTRALGDGIRFELELLAPPVGGTESPVDTPLYSACERYVAERLPGAVLLPVLCTGFTDSHFVRAAHRTVAYGFAPVFATDQDRYLRGLHNVDETLAVADLVEMVRFHVHAIRTLGREAARQGRSPAGGPGEIHAE